MILELQDNNDKLQILLRMLQVAKPFHAEQRSSYARDMDGVRKQVRRMHQVLSQHCQCSHPAHEAKLGLRRGYHERKFLDDLYFETILYRTPSTPRLIKVHVTASHFSNRKVQIQIEDDDDSDINTIQQRQLIADVCLILSVSEHKVLRFDLDDTGKLWQTNMPQSSSMVIPDKFYTLDSLLEAASLHRKEPKWLAKEKKVLSVILSHSLLHLEGSEWLRGGWRAQMITFGHEQELVLSKAPRFSLNRPYMYTSIPSKDAFLTTGLHGSGISDLTISERCGHPIPTLLHLGILLLELYLNGPLSSAVDVDPVDNVQLWAMSVLGSCREDKDMEPSYYNAIQFCLWPPWPSAGECSFENATFRDDYYQKVVMPLEDALTEGFDFTKEDLATL